MNKDITLKDLYSALQKEMVSNCQFSNVLNHPSDKGDNAEESWVSWFNNYLPKRYRASKATVIDSNGHISDQIDVVLYDAQYSYLAFNQNGILYIPAESVYAVFEVKQNLNKAHLEYAGKKAGSVRNLFRTSAPIPYANGIYKPKEPHRIISGILASNSDWENAYGKPFRECILRFKEYERVDCGCILDCGMFFCNYEEKNLKTSNSEESLVAFFLQLLIQLQAMGTVPAIDLNAYMKAIITHEEVIDG